MIKLFNILNVVWLIVVELILYVVYKKINENYLWYILLAISLMMFFGFVANAIFIWIVSKSHNKKLLTFFSTEGRKKIRKNISEYFNEENAKKYRTVIFFQKIIFIVMALVLISIPVYINLYLK